MTKILIDRSVVEQAVKQIGLHCRFHENGCVYLDDVLSSLRAALEQPQVKQEPVAWMYDATFMDGTPLTDWLTSKDPREVCLHEEDARNIRPLYLSQQPPRQPLTDEEIRDVAFDVDAAYGSVIEFARAIERAHGIGGEA